MLGEQGPLESYLKQYFYDKDKIPTTSIVSYGLSPLVKLSGDDSLFKLWKNREKESLIKGNNKQLLNLYKEFCVSELNKILEAFKNNVSEDKWTPDKKISRFLTPTSINGLINCLRLLIKNNKTGSTEYYQEKLKQISNFKFEDYKSSQWTSLGDELYKKFFEN